MSLVTQLLFVQLSFPRLVFNKLIKIQIIVTCSCICLRTLNVGSSALVTLFFVRTALIRLHAPGARMRLNRAHAATRALLLQPAGSTHPSGQPAACSRETWLAPPTEETRKSWAHPRKCTDARGCKLSVNRESVQCLTLIFHPRGAI